MIKSIKVRLNPNNKQLTKLFKYAGCARFAYNWAINREEENYKQGNKFLSDNELRKEFTQLKKLQEYKWLNEVSNDGLYWYVSVGVEVDDNTENTPPLNEGIGIDLGIKDLAVCSDGNTYKNINKTQKVKKLEKKKRRLQRSISKKYNKNKKGENYCKTSNIIKREKELLKISKRLTNIRQNYLHQTTSEIVKRKPSFICIEDLNVSGMMKNRHLSKEIQQQGFYKFRRQIEYKAKWNNIPVIIADRFFPSSKICSCCGNIKKDLRLSDRIYKCECGNIINRDFQASLNLKKYGENVLKQQFVA